MTEAEWLAERRPDKLLEYFETAPFSEQSVRFTRRFRLFAVACCYLVRPPQASPLLMACLATAELHADSAASDLELKQARCVTADSDGTFFHECVSATVTPFTRIGPRISLGGDDELLVHTEPHSVACVVLYAASMTVAYEGATSLHFRRQPPQSCFEALVRDIFGNPFRPMAFDPAWRTDTAVALARQMYDSREFGAMPILADALQDAGCEDEQVLNHCRDANQVHVRGCWVCDLVLGKE